MLCANPQSTLGMHVSLPENRGGSRIQTWNRYAYVANNPLTNIDPLGLDDLPPMLPPGDGPDDCGYICDSPPISFPFPIPVDGGGGGGGHPHPPSNPAPSNPAPSNTPSQSVHFPNETNGIPNGLNVNFGGPLGAILPSAICGDMGPCPTIGSGFAPGPLVLAGAGGETICLILEPCGAGELIFGGIFIATVKAIDTYQYFAKGEHRMLRTIMCGRWPAKCRGTTARI